MSNLLSPCDGMHVCSDKISSYTLIRKSWVVFCFVFVFVFVFFLVVFCLFFVVVVVVVFVCFFFVFFFWGGGVNSEPILTPRGKSPVPEAQRRLNPRRCIMQDSEPNTLPSWLHRPIGSSLNFIQIG